MLDRNICINLEDKIVAVDSKSFVGDDFLPLLWQHEPRAVLFCIESKPEAVMVRQEQKLYNDGRFPATTVPIPPDIYSSLASMGSLSLSPLVRIVNQSHVCLSFEFEGIDDKVLIAPYHHEYGFDPGEAIYLKGDHEDCQWLQYLLYIQQHAIMPADGHKSVVSFEEYVEELMAPEEHLTQLRGFSMD